MKFVKVIGLLVVSLIFSSAFAQDVTRCGTDVLLEQQLQDPKFKRSYKIHKMSFRSQVKVLNT